MPSIKGLGELDWQFSEISGVRSPLVGNLENMDDPRTPAEEWQTEIVRLSPLVQFPDGRIHVIRLLIRLNEYMQSKFDGNECGNFYVWDDGSGKWQYDKRYTREENGATVGVIEIKGEEKLCLPFSVRKMMEKLCRHLGAWYVSYIWWNQEYLTIETTFSYTSQLVIKNHCRFLEAISRKMSKWYKES